MEEKTSRLIKRMVTVILWSFVGEMVIYSASLMFIITEKYSLNFLSYLFYLCFDLNLVSVNMGCFLVGISFPFLIGVNYAFWNINKILGGSLNE